MATIKSYTDLEQSKKLAEILPLESADMCYLPTHIGDEHHFIASLSPYSMCTKMIDVSIKYCTPCWSLAALRNLLPTAVKPNKDTYLFESHNTFDNSWVYRYYNKDDTSYLYCKNANEVDACYEMIINY